MLRTTTAEPTASGIVWKLEKDVTAYSQLFFSSHSASLSIPNNVDSTYTGIPLVTISLTFYATDTYNPPPVNLPTVFAISSNTGNWTALGVSAGSNLTYNITLPYNDVVGVTLELMASPHGCEEFWYTNIDNDEAASEYGLCGGGVYRELQVYVDGILAGATNPFPVMYTGGINPFLWRPLTGIMSFDIPAYSFDLTPFVLGNGQAHQITVQVLGGDSEGGVWYLDTTLLLYRDASAAPVSGGMVSHSDNGSNVTSQSALTASGYYWNTSGTHTYSVQGQIVKASTTATPVTIDVEVSGALQAWNTNALTDHASVQTTNGALTTVHTDCLSTVLARSSSSSSPAEASPSSLRAVKSHSCYPYRITSSYKQDETTFDMRANVNMSYMRTSTYPNPSSSSSSTSSLSFPDKHYSVFWRNSLLSNAAYNRTLDHSVVYVESDNAAAGYFVSTDQKGCYQRVATAIEGYVVTDTQHGQCSLPAGAYICGYELCFGGDAGAGAEERFRSPRNDPTAVDGLVEEPLSLWLPEPSVEGATHARGFQQSNGRNQVVLVRNPLMGKKVLAKNLFS